ncbi:MAG: helix-turn-helix domain-containing protein [Lewinellaceae bacterium]|nr:helix-turn-helix domain-containing protein [Lewinellaceae bacterium]
MMEPKKQTPQPEILSAQDVMRILDISRNTFNKLWREGTIKVYRQGRKLYCLHSEIIDALKSQQAEA